MNEITILLSKRNKLWIGKDMGLTNPDPIKLAGILGQAGYVMSEGLKGRISVEYEKKLVETLEPYIKETFGLGKTWKSVWLTPPEDSKDLQSALYANPEVLEEIRDSQEIPDYWEVNGWKPDKLLEAGGDPDLTEIATSFLSSPIPLSSEDSEILGWLMDFRPSLVKTPEKILVKETLALALSHGCCESCISGVTDILRTAAYLSGESPILSRETRIKLSSKSRKIVLGLLERFLDSRDLLSAVRDAKKYAELWKIMLYHCHPDKKKYPRCSDFFLSLQSGAKRNRRTWESYLQGAYDKKDYHQVLYLLIQRPTEFMRRLDSLLRRFWESNDVELLMKTQSCFIQSSDNVPPKVLFELYRHFQRRGGTKDTKRSYLDKRGVRMYYDPLPPLSEDLIGISKEIIMSSLENIWKKKDTFNGKRVYLDIDDHTEFPVSFRAGTSGSSETMFPGQIIKFPTSGKIRFFSQWIDPKGEEDLDLHAWMLDDETGKFEGVSWRDKFSDDSHFITHSGDIRHQRGDCSEFVTLDYSHPIPFPWMLVTVQNYDGPRLCDVENWIGISEVGEDEVSTVFRGKVTSEVKNMAAFLVNLKEGWAKLVLEGTNVDSLTFGESFIREYLAPGLPTLRKLLEKYIKETGGVVIEEREEDCEVLGIPDLLSGRIHEYFLG